jgi:hypothetical protein
MTIYRGIDSVTGGTTVATAEQIAAAEAASAASAVAAAASAAAALVSEGLADADATAIAGTLVLTNADVVSTNADVVITNADAVTTNANVVITNADVVSSGINATNAQLEAWNAEAEKLTADSYATQLEDVFVDSYASDGDGTFTATPTAEYSSLHWAAKAAIDGGGGGGGTRNAALNQDPVSQGTSTETGMSSTIYTGNGSTQSITTGIDMSTGDFGGLVWIKNRDAIDAHILTDTVRAATNRLSSDSTAIEVADADTLTAFNSTGFALGADVKVNTNTEDYVAWSFQTNKKFTGTTNRNKAYTAHYNSDMGFSIVGYEGDGVEGHEIPHHLGVEPDLSIFKNRDDTTDWVVPLPSLGSNLLLNTTDIATTSSFFNIVDSSTVSLPSFDSRNKSTDNIISYHFASKPGVSKVGQYTGTGAAGNYVSCGFKPGFVLIKNMTSVNSWFLYDGLRGDNRLNPDATFAEAVSTAISFVDDGLEVNATGSGTNGLGDEYIFLAFAETSSDAAKFWADYSYPTTADTISIENNTVVSVANGFNASGQDDTSYEFTGGVTKVYGAGHEDKHYWLYTDKLGVLGQSESRPLTGLTRNDADKWGVVSPLDASLRTTAKHFDYESSTGVALASGDDVGAAWQAFDKKSNDIISNATSWVITATTNSSLQYKGVEKRILKSWRLRELASTPNTPKLFTIEGSNDGFAWTAIDSSYTASDYSGNGANLWGDIQLTAGNTTAYLYHRINITSNNGGGTLTGVSQLEFNTILPSDYYLVEEGKMYNSSDAAIERTYLAELLLNSDGEISWHKNLPVAKQQFTEVEVHEDLTVHGEIHNRGVCTAWVNFDGTQSPPLMRDSFNVRDVVELSTGKFSVLFENPMDDLSYFVVTGVGGSALVSKTLSTNSATQAGINAYDSSNVLADSQVMTLAVFGGKS